MNILKLIFCKLGIHKWSCKEFLLRHCVRCRYSWLGSGKIPKNKLRYVNEEWLSKDFTTLIRAVPKKFVKLEE